MNRKHFIKSAAVMTGAALSGSTLQAAGRLFAPTDATDKLKKGLGFSMIKEDLSLLDKFKLVKDLGYDGIEFNTPLDLDISDILKACQATDLRVPSVVNKDHWSKPLSDPDATVRKHTIDLDSTRSFMPHVENSGVKIGLVNVWHSFSLSPVEPPAFLDEIDPPLIGGYFDIGHSLRFGWPEHGIATLNTRIVKLQAKAV